ncbi:FAD-binding protein [Microbacterium thalassium]|uniref:3-oxosteroid 1-dehydrogenase n=1 Tax=Microbacterium thalassium TaxID=362649 RepID=A0A7X0FNJ7_9MICO|nr:FAD-binding protein [Microbacterium thalassium]MBB6390325.1 3-oxosteroid 1-dehydrogenase [Microbacterium thalassium]
MTEFDHTYDVVVVGSGAGAFATALGAADGGLSVLMLESTDKWGGNSAMSGGGLWLPNNPLMQRDGASDSRDEALAYMEETIGEIGRSTSRERKEAFVDGVADLVLTSEKHGIRFARATDYPDYYPELPGGKIGRAVEPAPYDRRRIGEWWSSSTAMMPLPAKTDDFWLLGRAWSTSSGFARGTQLAMRTAFGLLRGKFLVGMGAALGTAYLDAVVQRLGVPLWLNSPAEELIVEDDRVVGIRVTHDGDSLAIGATTGVMLAGGGFDRNREWRQKFQGVDGAPSGCRGALGHPIAMAGAAGAALELMDDAWWGASTAAPEGGEPSFLVSERSVPFSIIVDGKGDRFANESESYVDIGHRMLAHEGDGVFWLITDARHAHRYLRSYAMDPRVTKAMAEQGLSHRAASVEELATAIGIAPQRLRATIDRFNGFARTGVDADFGRGKSAYDRYYGDPTVRPNPNLGPLEKAPFAAVHLVAGDLGTKGGVVTDADARALREDGTVIDGLYATGNNSASVMGRTYPGPGSTIGPAMVFGMRAARAMAHARAEALSTAR